MIKETVVMVITQKQPHRPIMESRLSHITGRIDEVYVLHTSITRSKRINLLLNLNKDHPPHTTFVGLEPQPVNLGFIFYLLKLKVCCVGGCGWWVRDCSLTAM